MSDETPQHEVTRLLQAADNPGPANAEQLLTLVYDQLRKIAQQRMSEERAGHTLQATALVHEAYARLVANAELAWDSRGHFFTAAAETMAEIREPASFEEILRRFRETAGEDLADYLLRTCLRLWTSHESRLVRHTRRQYTPTAISACGL